MKHSSEKAILNDSLVAVSALPGTMAWRNNTGTAWQGEPVRAGIGTMIRVEAGMMILRQARPITFGLPGSGDIMGLTNGRAWALEIKDQHGQQRDTQKKFQAAFELAGGFYGLSRSVDFSRKLIEGLIP